MLELPLGSIGSHCDLFGQKLEYELGLTAPASIRARGFFASNFQALPFRSLSKTTCWGTYVLPPTQSSEDAEIVRDWGCDAGQGGYITRPMPLEAFIKAAAACKLQYSRQLAERKR